ncbi:MAG: carboxypeptidase regulatory-like domain-containing protein [bacterium]|nr:carboxypeptidase regulatory-like domain-containing protein [bacterium]
MRNVVRALFSVALLACTLTACNDSDLPPATKYATLKGMVIDSATSKPIAGATVIVDTVLTATTDQNGAFSFDKIPSGIVDYIVKASGYADVNASGNAEPGKPFVLNVSMQPPASP